MKKIMPPAFVAVALLFLGGLTSNAQQPIGFGKWATNTVAATPVQLYPTPLYVSTVTIYGKKADRTDNAAVVYIGVESDNDAQAIPVAVGGTTPVVITAKDNNKVFDLSAWYLDVGTDNDGVIIYFQ